MVFFTDLDVTILPNALPRMFINMKDQNAIADHFWMMNAKPVRDKTSKSYLSIDVWPDDKYPVYCSDTGYFMTGGV